jgi:hypothetical protein
VTIASSTYDITDRTILFPAFADVNLESMLLHDGGAFCHYSRFCIFPCEMQCGKEGANLSWEGAVG